MTTELAKRTSKGRFSQGLSGNPTGRPVGSRNRYTLFAEEFLRSRQEELIQKAVEMAMNGDPHALRLCIERILPVPRERRINITLPELTKVEHAPAVLARILEAVTEGEITVSEGLVLAQIVEVAKNVLEAKGSEESRKEFEEQSRALQAEIAKKWGGPTPDDKPEPSRPPDIPGGVH